MNSVLYFQNFSALTDSAYESIENKDWIILVPLIVYVFSWALISKKVIIESLRFRWISQTFILSPVFFFFFFWNQDLKKVYLSRGNENPFYFDVFHSTKYNGLLPLWIWELNRKKSIQLSDFEIKSFERKFFNRVSEDHKKGQSNVILIIVESLESWVINSRFESKEITPNLNSLLLQEKTCLFTNVHVQTKGGRSSDAQLMINTGLLPLKLGATCFDYPNNLFPSITLPMREKGYQTLIAVGGSETFWNYKRFALAQGFERIISNRDFEYENDDYFQFGILDSTFLIQTADIISKMKEPFFAELITTTSHFPFELPGRVDKKFTSSNNMIVKYLNSISYVDKSIGEFVKKIKESGLFANTIIIITGDHEAFGKTPKDFEFIKSKINTSNNQSFNSIPFIMVNCDKTLIQNEKKYQMDIYPTLVEYLDLDTRFGGFGNSFFDTCTNENRSIDYLESVSDSMIRSDFFRLIK